MSEEGSALLLSRGGNAPRAVAVLLDERETFDGTSARHQLSPVAFGLREAAEHGLEWLVALKDGRVRLYAGRTGVGTGQKGQTETYFEIDLTAVDEERAALLPLVFGADALEPQGSTQQILDGSATYATALGTRLRGRIYEDVVPKLAEAVAGQMPVMGIPVDEAGLRTAYRVTLRILFRLLFQAYAEDRGLLPAGRNERYDANSLKTAALRDLHTDPATFGSSSTLWKDLEQVWDAIDEGDDQWMIPQYNGGLFARDRGEGVFIARLRLPNSVMGPVLQALLADVDPEDGVRGPVDFASLSVREFGTIYEGLLESSLSLAESDLALDSGRTYVPAGDGEAVVVPAGAAYFHNSSGERKATGSYFTPIIVVDHLIERSIVPVLSKHLERIAALLKDGKEVEAGRAFFDFRVADLAMGSGHFLVAAIDKVEAKYRDFLTRHDVPRVTEELVRIEQKAKEALGRDSFAKQQVENVILLRRQVARRCIYGIDVNPLALELSRLALWIHTFVPGLPMSSFDHNLICANSLTGIGTVEEALAALEPGREAGQVSLVDHVVTDALAAATPLLLDAANADEADKAGVEEGADLRERAREQLEPIRRIFDLAVAIRTGEATPIMALDLEELDAAASTPQVREATEQLNPAHMPYLFPEVFQRENPGFDVLLGNPPWEEVIVEESKFWALKSPGLQRMEPASMQAKIRELRAVHPDLQRTYKRLLLLAEKQRKALSRAGFAGMGVGDVDLYKAFAWRNWQMTAPNGASGLVLPLSAWATKGSAAWRIEIFDSAGTDVTFFKNDGSWLFPDVNPGYRITATVLRREVLAGGITLSGPFRSSDQFADRRSKESVRLNARLILESDPDACLPVFSSDAEVRLWQELVLFPGLGDGRSPNRRPDFRCAPATDIHATLQGTKGPAYFVDPEADWPVHNHRNVDLFRFDKSVGAFARANVARVLSDSQEQRLRVARRPGSAFSLRPYEWNVDPSTLPMRNTRLVFRDVVHASNPRKVWVSLAPADTLLTNTAPYLVFDREDPAVSMYVLGVLGSGVVDWFGHLRINLHLNFFILYSLPVPLFRASTNQLAISEIAARLVQSDAGPEPAARELLRVELDARVWEEFELSDEYLELVFDPKNPTRSAVDAVTAELRSLREGRA